MPHKRNPVLTENLTGLSRLVRSAVLPALENVSLWHERDISHSSVERMIFPDVTITLDFALARLSDVVKNLLVYPDNMMKNLEKLGGERPISRTKASKSFCISVRMLAGCPPVGPADTVRC